MRKFIAAVFASLALGAGAAWADDFTLIVPVDVHNLPPEISRLTVRCGVWGGSRSDPTGPPPGVLGANDATVPITGGAYHGDVTVVINASSPSYARYATQYSCDYTLSFLAPDGSWRVLYPNDDRTFMPVSPTAPFIRTTGYVNLH